MNGNLQLMGVGFGHLPEEMDTSHRENTQESIRVFLAVSLCNLGRLPPVAHKESWSSDRDTNITTKLYPIYKKHKDCGWSKF